MVRALHLTIIIMLFPGTLMHETAHYAAAMILGKAQGFSLIPRRQGNRYTLGTVESTTRYKVLSAAVSAAPLLWWALLFTILRHLNIIGPYGTPSNLHLGTVIAGEKFYSFRDMLTLYSLLQLLWAGSLSRADILNILDGLFSLSGLLTASIGTAIYLLLR